MSNPPDLKMNLMACTNTGISCMFSQILHTCHDYLLHAYYNIFIIFVYVCVWVMLLLRYLQ